MTPVPVGTFSIGGGQPLALIAGGVRGIPLHWRLLDCSFGVFGLVPLWLALRWTGRLATCSARERPA